MLISSVKVSMHFFHQRKDFTDSSTGIEGISGTSAPMEGACLLSGCVFDGEFGRSFGMKTLMGL